MSKFNSDPRDSASYKSFLQAQANTSSASPPVLKFNPANPPITPQPTNNQFNSDGVESGTGAAIGAVIAGAAANPPMALVVGGIFLGGILIIAAWDYFESK